MKIVCISDTHAGHEFTEVPDGDILVHGGDITRRGSLEDVESFNAWLGTLPHKHKVMICGNHDFCFQDRAAEARARITNAIYLEDSGCEIEGLTFYGSPWQPWFGGWAFNLERGSALAEVWAKIPIGVDVLITHGPPEGILDRTIRGEAVGCRDLLARVYEVKPRLHVFGHIHEARGKVETEETIFVNASTHMGWGTGVVVELSSLGSRQGDS
ncbi:MAG TPA: metallophosphatase domain-containing protein [Gemmata sp.]|nr:metallophosphatase domain-containing protein [Gemmata sp.]